MSNPYWNNQHGANRKSPEGASNTSKGSKTGTGTPMKTAAWPGVPGKTQSGSRSAGVKTTGKLGAFEVKKIGI